MSWNVVSPTLDEEMQKHRQVTWHGSCIKTGSIGGGALHALTSSNMSIPVFPHDRSKWFTWPFSLRAHGVKDPPKESPTN